MDLTYPITPEYILNLPRPAEQLILDLEDWLIKDICGRLTINNGSVSATARERIMQLMRYGYDSKRIAQYLAKMTGLTEKAVSDAIKEAMETAGGYYAELYRAGGLNIIPSDALAADLDAITRITNAEMKNITQSLGFALRGPTGVIQWYSPAEAYQRVLDDALMRVNSGISYNQSMRQAVLQLADSGIQAVEYDKVYGPKHHTVNRADVAVRRAVTTGVTKISQAYADRAADDLGTPYIEVTAHSGARDVDRPNPWSNHKKWQGKVYSRQANDIYPSVFEVCGLGEVDGLCGANCRHSYHPYVPGVSQRAYTDKELQEIDKPPFEYNGKTYTQYQASQVMRKAETRLRDLKRRMIATSSSGDREAYTTAAARYNATKSEYKAFAGAAGLRNQMYDRAYVFDWGPKEERAAEAALQEAQNASNDSV